MRKALVLLSVMGLASVLSADTELTLFDGTTHYFQMAPANAMSQSYKVILPPGPGLTAQGLSIQNVYPSSATLQWSTPGGGGGASSLQVMVNGVQASSPTASLGFNGSGVSYTNAGTSTTVTISGGGGVSLSSTNTWTAQQSWTSASPSTFTLLNISTFTASSATVTGNTYLKNVNISGTCTGSGCGTKPALTYVFGGATNAAPLQAGTTVYIHTKFAGTINSVSLDCYPNVSDTFSVNVSTGASSNPNALSSICASDCPALSGASSETDTTLTGWTTAFTANSYIAVSLPSVPPVCTYAVLTIGVN